MIRSGGRSRACVRIGGTFLVVLAFFATGCGGPGLRPILDGERRESSPLPATALLPVDALGGSLWLRQHVTIRWDGREEGFDAVLQKRKGRLLLLGLGPMNTLGFRLELGREGVVFENHSGREMPFRPEHVLADVQRVFYPWIVDEPACSGCIRRATRAGLGVVERIGDRHLEERRFLDLDHPERGEIVVRYESWREGGSVPARAILENTWYGYELTIETIASETLDPP